MGEEFLDVKEEAEGSGVFNAERSAELNAREVLIIGKVVDVALKLLFGIAVFPFDREENVAASPVPMEVIEV